MKIRPQSTGNDPSGRIAFNPGFAIPKSAGVQLECLNHTNWLGRSQEIIHGPSFMQVRMLILS